MRELDEDGGQRVDREELVSLIQDRGQEWTAKGTWLVTFCPAHDDGVKHGGRGGQSLALSNSGVLKCLAGCEFKDIMAELKGETSPPWQEERKPKKLAPPKLKAREPQEDGIVIRQQWTGPNDPVSVYQYKDVDGALRAEKARFETEDGHKSFTWRLPGETAWSGLGSVRVPDLPLYGAHLLKDRPDEPVYFVEGEKACEACWDAGLLAVTCAGGASQADFGKGLNPLRGRDVYLWPDNDPPGRKYMNQLYAQLYGVAGSLRFIHANVSLKGDAHDYFGAGGTVEALLASSPSEPRVEFQAEKDAIQVVIPTIQGVITFLFKEMEKTRRGLETEATVSVSTLHGKFTQHLNLSSQSGTETFRRSLDLMYGKEFNWTKELNIATNMARDAFMDNIEAYSVAEIPLQDEDVMLAPPFLANAPNIFFGDGSSFKSFITFALSYCLSYGHRFVGYDMPRVKVMILDYEDEASNVRQRLTRLAKGLGGDSPPVDVYYFDPEGVPLKDKVEAVKQAVQAMGIGLLLIDSAGPACGGDPSAPDTALDFFRALKKIGLPSIIIAHVNKGGDIDKPYGSVYWHNEARRTWWVQRLQDEDSDELDVILHCKKVNDGRRPSPIGLHVTFDEEKGAVRITNRDMDVMGTMHDEVRQSFPPFKQVLMALNDGPKTHAELVELTGLSHAQVGRCLRSGEVEASGVKSGPGGRPETVYAKR